MKITDLRHKEYALNDVRSLGEAGVIEDMIGDNIYIFHTPKEDQDGFNFAVFEVIGYEPAKDITNVVPLISGIAYFDGIRHLEFSDDGYMNYPDLTVLIAVFERLKILETMYCWDKD